MERYYVEGIELSNGSKYIVMDRGKSPPVMLADFYSELLARRFCEELNYREVLMKLNNGEFINNERNTGSEPN